MARERSPFFCISCGNETLKWEGRCPACGDWNTLRNAPAAAVAGSTSRGSSRRTRAATEPVVLRDAAEDGSERRAVRPRAVHRMLGGGLVPGSLVLLGGEPGIGKSTLLLQLAAHARRSGDVLYVSGEESARQVRMRAARIGSGAEEVTFLAATDVDRIAEVAAELSPRLLCVDSVQTLRTGDVDSSSGSVPQVRECVARLQDFAKDRDTAVFLVGHVTKGGGLAGPRTLEHMVDVVLRFEGQRSLEHRLLRATKNRFGSVDELAVFRMTRQGLRTVENPSELFLEDRPARISGSAVAVPLHGTRPLLAEVQTLTGRSRFSNPRRVTTGFPSRRLSMLLTVLERRAGLELADADVFVNVIGGLTLTDPGTDLAVASALVSVEADRPLPGDFAFVGEVGLGGEIRTVPQGERRLSEIARSGLRGAAVPDGMVTGRSGLTLRRVDHVREIRSLLDGEH